MQDSTFVALQKALPKQLLTEFMGSLARAQAGGLTHWVAKRFAEHYGVNMSEAANPDFTSYKSFNEFFTRPLRPDARPMGSAHWVCPVDGAISQFGEITGDAGDQIFQAKGHHYSALALLGGDASLAAKFTGGSFATIYLSPKDYHRIHMPCAGRLTEMIYIPGKLYSVNPATARGIPGLFAVNERVVCVFDTDDGPFVNVLVGATIVGSMATVWHGVVNPPRAGEIKRYRYDNEPVMLAKGAEMGRFLLGSTVVMLWPKSTISFERSWEPGKPVRLNENMGEQVAA